MTSLLVPSLSHRSVTDIPGMMFTCLLKDLTCVRASRLSRKRGSVGYSTKSWYYHVVQSLVIPTPNEEHGASYIKTISFCLTPLCNLKVSLTVLVFSATTSTTCLTNRSRSRTLDAAPPLMMDFTKMPRSAWFSLERFPLTLTPSPAEPESLRGISKVRNSRVPSGVRTRSSSSAFCYGRGQGQEEL